jgi:hypothetical protein
LIKRRQPLPGFQELFRVSGINGPVAILIDFAEPQSNFSLLSECIKQFVTVLGDIGLGKIDSTIIDGMVGFAVIGQCIVEEDPVDMLVPLSAAIASQKPDVLLAHAADAVGYLGYGIAAIGVDEFGKAFEEEATIDKDGNVAVAHG